MIFLHSAIVTHNQEQQTSPIQSVSSTPRQEPYVIMLIEAFVTVYFSSEPLQHRRISLNQINSKFLSFIFMKRSLNFAIPSLIYWNKIVLFHWLTDSI